MIDRKTGSITLSATCQLKPGDAFADVFALSFGETQEVADRKNGWKWLTSKNGKVAENYFIISLGFYTDALKQIDLVVSRDRFNEAANWDAWSEQRELDSLKKLRTWLINELGREGKFTWGDAQAGYDPRAGYSAISIRYR